MDDQSPEEAFWHAVKKNRKIDAIKAYQEWTGEGVKPCADYVLKNWEELRLKSTTHVGR